MVTLIKNIIKSINEWLIDYKLDKIVDNMEDSYKEYPLDTKVKIKSTGEVGEAFESMFGVISVFVDGDNDCKYIDIEDIEFL